MCKKGNSFGGSPKNLENLGWAQVAQATYESFYGKYSLHEIDELKSVKVINNISILLPGVIVFLSQLEHWHYLTWLCNGKGKSLSITHVKSLSG